MNTYKVELPNGKIDVRNSKKVFTHAVVADVVDGDREFGFQVWAYAGSKELAEKAFALLQTAPRKILL